MSVYSYPVGETEAVIECDATDCDAKVVVRSAKFHLTNEDDAAKKAEAAGWSAYLSRSRRHYCPTHVPRPGHTMRRVW